MKTNAYMVVAAALLIVMVSLGVACAATPAPPRVTYEIVVVFSDFTAHLFAPDGEELFVTKVALPRHTPKLPVEGKLVGIQRHPWWYPPPGVKAYVLKKEGIVLPDKVPPGPNSPMGPVKFLFAFSTPGAEQLSRMHGTNHPESIGRRASSGCIRLKNPKALELADVVEPLLDDGARIKIRYVEKLDERVPEAEAELQAAVVDR